MALATETAICTRCLEEKPLDEFAVRAAAIEYLRGE